MISRRRGSVHSSKLADAAAVIASGVVVGICWVSDMPSLLGRRGWGRMLERVSTATTLCPGMAGPPDPYQTLGIDPSASEVELRAAYRRAVQRHHPDHNNGSAEAGPPLGGGHGG